MTEPLRFHLQVSPQSVRVQPATPRASVQTTSVARTIIAGVPGARGAKGDTGVTTFVGAAWWYGEGPPGTIIGAKPGDKYLDTDSGTIYTLGG